MTIRESHGVFRVTEAVEPEWSAYPLPGSLELQAVAIGTGADLWALARGRPRRHRSVRTLLMRVRQALGRAQSVGPGPPADRDPNMVPVIGHRSGRRNVHSYVLVRRPDVGWTTEARLAGPMNALAVLHDGTVALGGDGVLALRSAAGEWAVRDAPSLLTRVWGSGARCVYALGETVHGKGPPGKSGLEATWVSCGLFYFDGDTWAEIDLGERHLPGFFVDGACDRDGYGWIVGTYATHSCMARGRGTEWEPDGCSSWYLYHVYVDPDRNAFALGGDGLWRHHADYGWQEVEAFGRAIGQPLALGVVRGQPWVVDARNLFGWRERRMPSVGLFLGGFWVTLVAPAESLSHPGPVVFAITKRGEVVTGSGNSVWQSPSLERVVLEVWPPKRITPAEDPQLGSTEPLVRAWNVLPESQRLRVWCWCGDGMVGTVGRREWSLLHRWHRLSEAPEKVAELDFDPLMISLAPNTESVIVVPKELDERGVYRRPRRVARIDIMSGAMHEMPLPAGFEYDEVWVNSAWSPDGSRLVIEARKPRDGAQRRELLVLRADDLALEQALAIPDGAYLRRWEPRGIVLSEPRSAGPFANVPVTWLEPDTGALHPGVDREDESPDGRYRVRLRGTTIVVTTIADGTTRELAPTPGGVLDTIDAHGEPRILGAGWVGNRLQLSARLLGPVHLDLETLTLRYALPPRAEGEQAPTWSPDGRLALRRGIPRSTTRDLSSLPWEWGAVEE